MDDAWDLSSIKSAVTREECEFLSCAARNMWVLEIGSEYGRSTIAMARTAWRVDSVDWHRGDGFSGEKDSLPDFWNNVKRLGVQDKVHVHVGRSEVVLEDFAYDRWDIGFLDGDHSAKQVCDDLIHMNRCVRSHIYVHDWTMPTVKDGIAAFLETVRGTRKAQLLPSEIVGFRNLVEISPMLRGKPL